MPIVKYKSEFVTPLTTAKRSLFVMAACDCYSCINIYMLVFDISHPFMTAEFPAIVGFKRALIITLVLSGGAIFFSSTLSFLAGHFPFGFIASFVFVFAGVSLQRHTYFRLDRHELIVYKPTGKEDYRCALTSPRDLDIDSETDDVYLLSAGDRRKVPLYRWLAEDEDWETFRALVTATSHDPGEAVETPVKEIEENTAINVDAEVLRASVTPSDPSAAESPSASDPS